MSKGLQWFIGLVIAIFIAIAVLFYLIRFHDGPMEILSGGPFKSGEFVTPAEDWSFLGDQLTLELQTMLPPRSRTMWMVVYNNRLFVVSSYMNTLIGRVWKQWPKKVEQDNRAIVRVDNHLYKMRLTRHTEGDFIEPVLNRFNEKYNTNFDRDVIDNGSSWLFELQPR